MLDVKIFNLGYVSDKEYTRVVCVSEYHGKWVFARNKNRNGWEIPGGHIEKGEDWLTAAKREMFEETGATKINVTPICVYKISSYALLCYVEIEELGELPNFEMSEIGVFDDIPRDLTYPDTHKLFFETVKNKIKKF